MSGGKGLWMWLRAFDFSRNNVLKENASESIVVEH